METYSGSKELPSAVAWIRDLCSQLNCVSINGFRLHHSPSFVHGKTSLRNLFLADNRLINFASASTTSLTFTQFNKFAFTSNK